MRKFYTRSLTGYGKLRILDSLLREHLKVFWTRNLLGERQGIELLSFYETSEQPTTTKSISGLWVAYYMNWWSAQDHSHQTSLSSNTTKSTRL